MPWNPLLNAAGAALYIGAVATFIRTISAARHDTPDTIPDSMAALALLVLSAAVMAFLFFYRPVSLLIEGKRDEALAFFLKTLAAFGVITILVLARSMLQ